MVLHPQIHHIGSHLSETKIEQNLRNETVMYKEGNKKALYDILNLRLQVPSIAVRFFRARYSNEDSNTLLKNQIEKTHSFL